MWEFSRRLKGRYDKSRHASSLKTYHVLIENFGEICLQTEQKFQTSSEIDSTIRLMSWIQDRLDKPMHHRTWKLGSRSLGRSGSIKIVRSRVSGLRPKQSSNVFRAMRTVLKVRSK